jgi:hypothetical protein
MSTPLQDVLQLSQRAATHAAVDVEVRGDEGEWPAAARLSLHGPCCQQRRTLPARIPLERHADGVWRARIVDPCYWSPGFPAHYRLQLEDAAGAPVGPTASVALRRLEAHGPHLWLDGRRWVFRAAEHVRVDVEDVDKWSEQLLGLVVDTLAADIADEASRCGVPLAVRVPDEGWQSSLRQAVWHPAVQMAVVPAVWKGDVGELRARAADLLLVADLTGAPPSLVPAWADALLCPADANLLEAANRQPPRPRALLAYATDSALGDEATPWNAQRYRQACERLQRDLAPRFDLSGYIVG